MLEIIDLDVLGDFLSFPYESSSPFLEKFDITMRGIIDSGIKKYLKNFDFKLESFDSESLFDNLIK